MRCKDGVRCRQEWRSNWRLTGEDVNPSAPKCARGERRRKSTFINEAPACNVEEHSATLHLGDLGCADQWRIPKCWHMQGDDV